MDDATGRSGGARTVRGALSLCVVSTAVLSVLLMPLWLGTVGYALAER